jgi:two-component system, NarL family, sensor histidine kinase FusK
VPGGSICRATGNPEGWAVQMGMTANTWLRHLAVAVAYGLGTTLFRQGLIPHWMLLCGFHLSVLLLTPYRYWPALLVGEAASLAHLSYACVDQYGLTWAILNLKPSAVVVMPIVYLCRERWHLFSGRNTVNMGALLAGSLLVACAMTLNNLILLLTVKLPLGYAAIHYDQAIPQWMLGNFLGILTVTPLVLAVQQSLRGLDWNALQKKLSESRLLFESVLLLVPALAFLIWVGLHAEPARAIVQMAMFLPVVWLALRHGWKGAAVGGTTASIAIMILMPASNDHNTLEAEVVVAFAISTMLLVGARIALLDRRVQQERMDVRMALALAQRNVNLGEMQLRMTSQALEQIRETVQSACTVMIDRLRYLQPAIDERGYHRQVLVAQDQIHRLADSLYPRNWQDRGLPAVLREGALPRVLDEAGVAYWCDIKGPIGGLSPPIHLTIYRVVCEAVADICAERSVSAISIHVRCGRGKGRQFAVLRIDAHAHPARLARIRWDELMPRVLRSSSGLGLQAIRDRAATYEGLARDRVLHDGRRISAILLDPEYPSS